MPKFSFGVTVKMNDNLVMISKHERIMESEDRCGPDLDKNVRNHAFSSGHRQFRDSGFSHVFYKGRLKKVLCFA